MEYDFAIIYFGLTRSTKKVYHTHIANLFSVLDNNNLTYKKFIHTWSIVGKQRIWEETIPQEIDYNEYTLLKPDFYKLDSQEEFLQTIDITQYFYIDVWNTIGHGHHGEWLPGLLVNHLCALESQKRGLEMVEKSGNTFKYVMFMRPDVSICEPLPIKQIFQSPFDIVIPNDSCYEGYNDRFAIITYKNAGFYGKRINEIVEFRKTNGRIVSEKYVKFIIDKYKLLLQLIEFKFEIIRP